MASNNNDSTSSTTAAAATSSPTRRCSCALVTAHVLNNKGAFLIMNGHHHEAIHTFQSALRIMGQGLASLQKEVKQEAPPCQRTTTTTLCSCCFTVTLSPQFLVPGKSCSAAPSSRPRSQDTMYQQDEENTTFLYKEPFHVQLVLKQYNHQCPAPHPSSCSFLHGAVINDLAPNATSMTHQSPRTTKAKNDDSCGTGSHHHDYNLTTSCSASQPIASIIEKKKFMMNFMVAILIFNSALASHMLQIRSSAPEYICSTRITSRREQNECARDLGVPEEDPPQCSQATLPRKRLMAPRRIYQQSIQLFMALFSEYDEPEGGEDVVVVTSHRQLDQEKLCHYHSTCKLAISAALNNLLVMAMMNDDSNDSDKETLCQAFYQITATWHEQEGDHELDMQDSHHRQLRLQQEEPSVSSQQHVDSSFTRHCREWRGVFFQNALMMQLRRFGIFRMPYHVAAAA